MRDPWQLGDGGVDAPDLVTNSAGTLLIPVPICGLLRALPTLQGVLRGWDMGQESSLHALPVVECPGCRTKMQVVGTEPAPNDQHSVHPTSPVTFWFFERIEFQFANNATMASIVAKNNHRTKAQIPEIATSTAAQWF